MFHILGSPRSGTTLIAQCISSHPNVIVPHDTDFMTPVAFVYDRIKNKATGKAIISNIITESDSYDKSIGEYITKNQVRTLINDCEYDISVIVRSIFKEIAHQLSKKLVGNKSTKELGGIEVLQKTHLISDAIKIIHVVRDCRDVMASLISLGWVNANNSTYARTWASQNLYLAELLSGNSNYFLIRYEDFILEPRVYLEKLSHFIGIDFNEKMLDPKCRHKRYLDMGQIHSSLFKEINDASVGRFKYIEERFINRYTRQSERTLKFFGYLDRLK
jgi:hypothetical protein